VPVGVRAKDVLGEAVEVTFLDIYEIEGLEIAEAELGRDFVIEIVENGSLGGRYGRIDLWFEVTPELVECGVDGLGGTTGLVDRKDAALEVDT
jgi:hypothetical protein